ncbi:MAG: sulfotransferase, partial [Gammaproteobacteria bacterium]|nr:sulfotransferase [Gammaproteobacteria bacterium]
MNDIFLIGGSPSSGSTLLVSLLNNQEDVLCLPETGLFVHGKNLIEDHPDATEIDINLHLPWVDTGAKVSQAIGLDIDTFDKASSDFPTAFDLLRYYINSTTAPYLVEKTPENIFGFYYYLESSMKNRVVVTIRDALSVTQSLHRRGFTIVEALIIWFGHSYETARLIQKFPDQVFPCTYEQLTRHPQETIHEIIEFWGIDPKQKSVDKELVTEKPSSEEQVNPTYESSEMISFLVDYSSWNLADTAWTKSPFSDASYSEPVNMLGLAFQVLFGDLAFLTKHNGLLKPSDLENFLLNKKRGLDATTDLYQVPLEIAASSEFIRKLSET